MGPCVNSLSPVEVRPHYRFQFGCFSHVHLSLVQSTPLKTCTPTDPSWLSNTWIRWQMVGCLVTADQYDDTHEDVSREKRRYELNQHSMGFASFHWNSWTRLTNEQRNPVSMHFTEENTAFLWSVESEKSKRAKLSSVTLPPILWRQSEL